MPSQALWVLAYRGGEMMLGVLKHGLSIESLLTKTKNPSDYSLGFFKYGAGRKVRPYTSTLERLRSPS